MSRPTAKRNLLVLAGAAMALGVAALGVVPGFLDAVGYLLPAALLLLAIAGWRYPGERALVALIETRRARERSTPRAMSTARRRPWPMLPRGGRLLASSLAVRPPPALLLARS